MSGGHFSEKAGMRGRSTARFGGTGKEVVNQSPEIAAELKRNSRQ
jgi:hypothetical protein